MTMKRRKFLNQSTLTRAGLLILPSGIMAGTNSTNNKLNIALIGVWGRAPRPLWVAQRAECRIQSDMSYSK